MALIGARLFLSRQGPDRYLVHKVIIAKAMARLRKDSPRRAYYIFMKILGTGLSGLVGSRIIELLSDHHSFENLSLDTGIDITKKDLVDTYIDRSDAPWVFHFAAITDVDGAEKEKELKEKSEAWVVNVLATEYIVEACKRTQKNLLYISTDFVFDGTREQYSEDDNPNPQSWYAITKYEGEKRVMALGSSALIIRIAFPYRVQFVGKKDFVSSIRNTLESGQKLLSPTDQLFTPTFIDDIAWAIDRLIQNNASGIFHVVGSQALSPFDAGQKIAKAFGLNVNLVKPTTFSQYYQGRAPRPFRAALKNDKITKFGVGMSTFDEGLATIASQPFKGN